MTTILHLLQFQIGENAYVFFKIKFNPLAAYALVCPLPNIRSVACSNFKKETEVAVV